MKGTILDFLNLVNDQPELARELGELAAKYDFEFALPDEVGDEQLEGVTGGSLRERSAWMNDASTAALVWRAVTTLAEVQSTAPTQDAVQSATPTQQTVK